MENNKNQRNFWENEFGTHYIERNKTLEEINEFYRQQTGITQEEIFRNFFYEINRKYKILEIGCNIGLKLSILKKMGFSNLFGVEVNKNAYEIAKKSDPDIFFINSSIEKFESNREQFDLVYTSGVLIHIHPSALNAIIKKIVNLTKEYIFGFEYYSDALVEIPYRDHTNVCWKQNFPLLFKKLFPSLTTIKEEKIHYKNKDLCDIAYLLSKT
jgi:pseudaminic acid biosynthesis-associated methylase